MVFVDFLREILGITKDFSIVEIYKEETPEKVIEIHLKYIPTSYTKNNVFYKLYDFTPKRKWQHLSWFDYKCYIVCQLPRYIDEQGKPKIIDISFAPKGKGYTYLFAHHIIKSLQIIRVQKTVAELYQTSSYIVRSIMNDAVEKALNTRGAINDFKNISIDEKAYTKGHKYSSILIDSDKDYVIELIEGRKEKNVRALFFSINSQERQPQIKRVNMDMWKPFMKVIKDIAPKALIVHDKFHLFKKLSEAIDKTRKKEVKENELLKSHKYTVLKNKENRTEKQKIAFAEIDKANLNTAKAWHIRENFKTLFNVENKHQIEQLFEEWMTHSKEIGIKYVNTVIATFERHKQGIINAFETRTDSGKHENLNGRIQSILAKARGFLNFDRFRINVLFYFGKLELLPQKFY